MKKVAIVLPVLPHYRVDFINRLGKRLNSDNIQLKIISGTNINAKEIKEVTDLEVPYIVTNTFGIDIFGFKIQWQKKLIKEVLKFKPDKVVFLYHAGKVNYNILILILRIKSIPFTIWGSGSGDSEDIRRELSKIQLRFKWFLKKNLFNKAHNYISYSNHYANKLESMGYNKKNIFVANNTIDVESIIKKQQKFKSQSKSNNIRFIFVGALTPQKKLGKAIDALSIIRDKGIKNFTFDIIGNGQEFDSIQNKIIEYNLSDSIKMHGAKYGDELKYFFSNSDVFLLPGTGGLAVNEAMAHGLPVISTPGDGTGYDLIINGRNGILLDFNYQTEDLINSIQFMLNLDKKRLEDIGKASTVIVKEKASMENMVERFYKAIVQ